MKTTRMLKACKRWASQTAILLSILGLPAIAAAQDRAPSSNGDGMDTHLFRPAVDSKGFFSVNGSDILGAGNLSFGLVLDYGKNLMRTREHRVPSGTIINEQGMAVDGECKDETCIVGPGQDGVGVKALVPNSIQGTFGFNYGIANIGVVGLSIPVILMTGDQAYGIGPTGGTYNSGELNAQKISTLALHGKFRLTRVDRTVGLAAVIQAGIPIASAPRDLGADPGFWYWPQLVVENQFGSTRAFHVGVNVGYRGHTGDNPRYGLAPQSANLFQLKEGNFQASNLGTFSLGLSYRALEALDLVAETYGTYQLGGNSDSKQKWSEEFVG
ncbi:MAG TPA: hypothetical protein VEQ59_10300, partial [Polyangiaceae bacterium]|nr:hypothetical protein [Polyangiaceae bacterium]